MHTPISYTKSSSFSSNTSSSNKLPIFWDNSSYFLDSSYYVLKSNTWKFLFYSSRILKKKEIISPFNKMGPGSKHTIIVPKKQKKVSIIEDSYGPWRNTTWEGTQREAERIPSRTSFQSEPWKVIITLLQLAESERKCLFKDNTVIPTAFVQTCCHACHRRAC